MPEYTGKYRKLLIVAAIFALLFWLITLQVKSGRFVFLKKPTLAVSGFFERAITGAYDGLHSAWTGYVFLIGTRKESDRLRAEIDRLRLEGQITNELLIENERLREALNFKKRHSPSSIVIQVIGKEVSPSSTTVSVNKGSADGIEKNMAVISPDGVVGRVHTALANTSTVILLTDPGSTLAVRVQRNREDGLLEGKLSHCALKYVSYYADIQEGDLLVTSGMDGVFPKGLPVAVVSSVKKHESRPFQTVTAKPVVSFSRLEEALALKQ